MRNKVLVALVLAATVIISPSVAFADEPVDDPTVEIIPVIPNEPVVSQTYGSCVNGVWVNQPALVTLPSVPNGRWLDQSSGAGFVPTKTFNAAPGEYTYGFIAAEGSFYIPESPGGADDYRLENGVAYYTITINSVEPQDCRIAVTPYAPKISLKASWKCVNGVAVDYWGYIYSPSKVGQKWKSNGASVATSFYFSPSASATYVYTAVANPGYRIEGQSTWTFTITPVTKPVC
jgi:hypothetical protein